MNAWSIALDSIWHHRLRSGLTALGVVIGVFAVVTLTSLGSGVKAYVTRQFNRFGAELITVVPAFPGSGRGSHRGEFNLVAPPSTLTLADAQALAGLRARGVEAVAPLEQVPALVSLGSGPGTATAVIGTTAPYFPMEQLAFAAGGVTGGLQGAVLGHAVAYDLFGGADPVGHTIAVNGRAIRVQGVLRAAGNQLGSDPDQAVFIPVAQALTLAGTHHVSEIVIQAAGTASVAGARRAVQQLLARRHPLGDFTVITAGQILSTIQSTLSVITSVLGGIAAISLLVGGIGIMNIMLVTVTERVREIGVRKALGARDGDILVQFLVESVLLAVLGGAVGTAFAGLAAHIIGDTIRVPIALTAASIGLALGFSVTVGAVFGVLPAMRAARLMPAEALRTE